MKLQKLLFPHPEFCMTESLYYRRNEKVYLNEHSEELIFQKDGYASFDTYFNGFSIGKWKKYTVLDEPKLKLSLSGKFIVSIVNFELINGVILRKVVSEQTIEAEIRKELSFSFSGFHQKGMCTFVLYALTDDSVFFGGEYYSDIDESSCAEVIIALNMCTFRKEEYIYKNTAIINEKLITNPESALYQKLHFYITDNGMTLDETRLKNPFIHLSKQNAFGSVGGFTRGLLSIFSDRKKYNLTHTIFLDDDITLDPEVLCRTYVFLRMLKEDYRDAWIGGGMLGLDFPTLQTESGGCIEAGEYKSLKGYLDISETYNCLFNEFEEGARINAWWYCGMPLAALDENSLPYPVYFHCDDMEFATRMCKHLILLNGICVWHEEFLYKPDTFYYDKRNREILYALHFKESATTGGAQKRLIRSVIGATLKYRYHDADEMMDGVDDFLKGPDWLVNADDRTKFETVRKNRLPTIPISNLSEPFDYNRYLSSLTYPGEGKAKRFLRKLTLNGWLLPARGTAIVPAEHATIYSFYRAKKAINYSAKYHTAYTTEKSYRSAFHVLNRLFRMLLKIQFKYPMVRNCYHDSLLKYTTKDFWQNHLKEDASK